MISDGWRKTNYCLQEMLLVLVLDNCTSGQLSVNNKERNKK